MNRITLLLIAIITFTFCRCKDKSRILLEQKIEKENAQCPIDEDDGFIIKKINIENNFVCYWTDNDEEVRPIFFMREKADLYKDVALKLYKSDSPENVELSKLCVESNIGIKHIFCGLKTSDTLIIQFDVDELKQ